MDNIEKVFNDYTNDFMKEEKNIEGYIDKYNHSYFVRDEALLVDEIFTKYSYEFRKLLEIESLYHDIGRFKQLQLTGSFFDPELTERYPRIKDHGDLGSKIMEENLLKKLFPDDRNFDDEIIRVIRLHTKDNKHLLMWLKKECIEQFKKYSLTELLTSPKLQLERRIMTITNVVIVQDSDRLDIFRKIVKGIWVPQNSDEQIDSEVWKLFREGNLPSIGELKARGYWNTNVGHLVRMNFINQMCLVPELQKIKDENLIEKVYAICGNEIVRGAYDYALERIDTLIDESEDKILVKKR